MRLGYYVGVSTAAAAACLLKAFHERPNFYSATVYLSQSNACLLIITNLLLVLACSFIYALQRLLYGPLRPIEIEQLSEKAWYAVLDTLLAMPSFREEVGGWLLAMFVLLLAGKVWGWIGEGKVDVLEQRPPANPRLFHTRLASSLLVSVFFDLWMLNYCVTTVMANPKPGMMVIFTFEFAVLTISSSFTLSRYLLTVISSRIEHEQTQKAIDDRKAEIRAERAAARQTETAIGQSAPASPPNEEPIEVDENEVDVPGWEEKRRYLFTLEVLTDFVKLMIYIVFLTVSITFNGLPMHIMRDVYMTFASFSKRVSDYIAYRRATSDMNTRYPDATTEEIRGDACIVCRENMVAWEQPNTQGQGQSAAQQPAVAPAPARRRDEGLRAKKLPCGHILHLRCLKAWLERQQVCPTCRRPVVAAIEATSTGQTAAGGPNAAAGHQGGRQAPRPGRARILNFGPVRIGFLNGPGDQIANVIRQLQNPQAAAGQNPAQAAHQQGPNHLGLEVPYLDPQQQLNADAAASTQSQISQIQQRIMQQARDLGIEQQQLGVLRAMELELARLRAMHGETGASSMTQRNAVQQQSSAQQQSSTRYAMAMHGNASQQFSNGHESLPAGMTLPEGWIVMPLHQGPDASLRTPNVLQPDPTQSSHDPVLHAVAPAAQEGANTTSGPTDDNGSPLFVPTVSATTGSIPVEPEASTATLIPEVASSSSAPTMNGSTNPWNQQGWSFADPPNGHAPESYDRQSSSTEDKATSGAVRVDDNTQPTSTGLDSEGKGKGRAPQVEDAPDSGT